uniref:Cadherin domain-containing protein n=1 Tax=Knipowitschia caucasica TaxID=637954 RepID=A0AAV2MF20_KNICA
MASLVLVLMFVPLLPLLPDSHAARLSGHIPENAPSGTAVRGLLLPRCARAGGPDTGPVTLRGEHSTDFELVPRAQGARLGLVSTRALDREFIAMYDLHANLPARCLPRRVHVQVEVSDVNDNTPYFTTGNRSVDLDALAPRGTELTRFDARDADAERNGRVLFFLCPGVPQLHVVPGSGQVLLVDSVHGLQRVTARLCVRDDADVPRTGEPVFLHVHVRSVAEHARRRRALLEELTYSVRVPEKVRVGQLLFTLPEPRFQQRRVELLSASTVTVERDTGRMYLARALSRDEEVTVRVHNLREEFGEGQCLPHEAEL